MPNDVAPPSDSNESTAHLRPIAPPTTSLQYLRAIWERRHFMVALPVEELRSSHQNTVLGNVWHLGNPLLSTAVYFIIFGTGLRAGRGIENFLLWLTIGVFTYGLTQRTVLAGATSISSNQGLMRSIRFPRALLPISVVIAEAVSFGFSLVVLLPVVLITGEGMSTRWLLLPVVFLIHTAFNQGGAFAAARLNDAFADIQQIIPFVLRLAAYFSGVMIPIQSFFDPQEHPVIATALAWNPVLIILDMYRWVLMGTPVTGAAVVRATTISLLVLVIGFRFFRAAEWRYGRG
jgi:teichoic acid transport system permease protein